MDDEAPTQVFDIPSGGDDPLGVDLVLCDACGAPNAAPRRTCGRCDASLDTPREPDLFALPDEVAPVDLPDDDEPTVPPRRAVATDEFDTEDASDDTIDDDATLPPAGQDATLLTPVVDPSLVRDRGASTSGPRDPTGKLPVIERESRPRAHTPIAGPPPATSPGRRWPVVALVVVAVVAGSVLGMAIATDAGPFADADPVRFDLAEYPGDPQDLQLGTATASSSAADSDPALAVDGDPQTAWVATDVDPVFTITLSTPVWLTSVVIATGQPPTVGGASGSGRITSAFLELNGERSASLVLRDQPGEQLIRLLTPVLTDRVAIVVAEVAGTDAAAITDLRLVGHVATVDDAASLS